MFKLNIYATIIKISKNAKFKVQGVSAIKKYDVIVLGGGPAGLTAAREISKTGLKTLLIEKNYIGSTPRSWITWYSGLKKAGCASAVKHRIDTLVFSSYLGGAYELKKSDSAVVDTKKLLLMLKARAIKAGAEIKEKEAVLKCVQNGGYAGVKTNKGYYKAGYFVDAMGWYSKNQRPLGKKEPRGDYMGCCAAEIKLEKPLKDISKAHIFHAPFPGKDYFWLLPYNKHEALAGCFAFEKLDAKSRARMEKSLNMYIKYMGAGGRRLKEIQGNIPLMERRYLRRGRIFFCGDSVSSPLPSSGFGLLRAIEEARLIGRCFKRGVKNNYSEYEEKIVALRYPGYELHYLVADILKNMDEVIFNKAVSGMKDNSVKFIKSFLKGNDLSLIFAAQALIAIFKTFTLKEIASMAIKRDYKEFLMRAARDYPKIKPGQIKKALKKLAGELKKTGIKELMKIRGRL
ncbi:MAG: NAD(P)/FAD-dependent oxidoreductase [Candidatus Goldbacteria bacterium]|nr:NAD(P)/FAD-dependent oxidoreductase [Candidatus Goldiibacteriota bacterium]